jgi:SAM-dependent methyltransferase
VRSAAVDVVICCEVLEHVASPDAVMAEIRRILRPEGVLIVSFPNYLNVPWLVLRMLADAFRRPEWIVRQPVDRLLTWIGMTRSLRRHGFDRADTVGWVLEPPGIYHWRRRRGLAPVRTSRIAQLAFHPVVLSAKRK